MGGWLRHHEAAQPLTVRHNAAVPGLIDEDSLLKVVLVLTLAGGQRTRCCPGGGWQLGGAGTMLGNQLLQFLMEKTNSGVSDMGTSQCRRNTNTQKGNIF